MSNFLQTDLWPSARMRQVSAETPSGSYRAAAALTPDDAALRCGLWANGQAAWGGGRTPGSAAPENKENAPPASAALDVVDVHYRSRSAHRCRLHMLPFKQALACSSTTGRWYSCIKHACALCLLLNDNRKLGTPSAPRRQTWERGQAGRGGGRAGRGGGRAGRAARAGRAHGGLEAADGCGQRAGAPAARAALGGSGPLRARRSALHVGCLLVTTQFNLLSWSITSRHTWDRAYVVVTAGRDAHSRRWRPCWTWLRATPAHSGPVSSLCSCAPAARTRRQPCLPPRERTGTVAMWLCVNVSS